MTDDQGPWAVGSSEDLNALTPNLDNLRKEGVMLHHCYSPTPVCSPARASVLTSRYGSELGIMDYLPENKPELKGLSSVIPTWPRLLKEAGYATGLIGKYHCGQQDEAHPTHIGYCEFSGFVHGGKVSKNPKLEVDGVEKVIEGYTPDVLTDLAIDFLSRHRQVSFALSLHYWAPHANTGVSTPTGDRTWLPLSEFDFQHFKFREIILPDPKFPELDIPRAKRMMREYLASVHSVDRNIGRLMEVLDDYGLTDKTVVIFTSDHGYNLGHHGIWHKGNGRFLLYDNRDDRPNMWEQSLRVPAIVKWPGVIPENSSVYQTVSHLDWFPTIAKMTQVDVSKDIILRGSNILPLLRGEYVLWNNDFFAQYRMRTGSSNAADMRSFQTNQWKLVKFLRHTRTDEFYDRMNDPEENKNLIDSKEPIIQAAIRKMEKLMHENMQAIGDPAL